MIKMQKGQFCFFWLLLFIFYLPKYVVALGCQVQFLFSGHNINIPSHSAWQKECPQKINTQCFPNAFRLNPNSLSGTTIFFPLTYTSCILAGMLFLQYSEADKGVSQMLEIISSLVQMEIVSVGGDHIWRIC